MIEIYDSDKIVFMAPLSRQDEFYVDETQEAELTSSTLEESDNQGDKDETNSFPKTRRLRKNPILIDSEQGPEPNHSEQENGTERLGMNGPMEESEDSSGSSFEELNHS